MDVKQTLIDAQAAVIGSVLISPEIVGDVMLRVSAEDFITPEYRHVYDAIRAQWSACRRSTWSRCCTAWEMRTGRCWCRSWPTHRRPPTGRPMPM
ncbi:MAG: DnaB-like helicase N-terminal domain-containing protein [Oscillospiraceae bacterium]